MKKTSITIISAAIMLLPTAFSSCSSEPVDGLWDPMKWKTEVKTIKEDGQRFTEVPTEGGTYEYTCKNYNHMWFYNVVEAKQFNGYYTPDGKVYENTDHQKHFDCPAAVVDIDGAHLAVTIKPNTTGQRRFIEIDVSVGDTGKTFRYRQE